MFFSQHFSFPCQYHSTIAPYSSIHLPPTLYNVFLPALQFPLSESFHHCSIATTDPLPPKLHKRHCSCTTVTQSLYVAIWQTVCVSRSCVFSVTVVFTCSLSVSVSAPSRDCCVQNNCRNSTERFQGEWEPVTSFFARRQTASFEVMILIGVPRSFVPRVQQCSWGQTERGSGGGSPLVRGSGGSCNLVQEISFRIVKFS